jgi:hypothetical protein
VIATPVGQTFNAPSGIVSKMDEKNHHLHKSVFIGEIKADGQFNVVWKTPARSGKPWSPYIEGNDSARRAGQEVKRRSGSGLLGASPPERDARPRASLLGPLLARFFLPLDLRSTTVRKLQFGAHVTSAQPTGSSMHKNFTFLIFCSDCHPFITEAPYALSADEVKASHGVGEAKRVTALNKAPPTQMRKLRFIQAWPMR